MSDAFAIEEVIGRPLVTLLLCAVVPLLTARLLWILLVGRLPEGSAREQGHALAPFRSAAFVVGLVQIQLAWMLGVSALGPALVGSPSSPLCEAFGALAAIVAFAAGGVGRLVEQPGHGRAEVLSAIALRLRMVPFFGGPLLAASLASRLPAIDLEGSELAIRWGVVALALVISALGIAYGGLLLAVSTRALVPASAEVRAMAREVAAREGVSLLAVLRLPTGASRFPNAAAIPWARTMVVTDRIVSILTPDELRAVLAHEAGHLSEGWSVIAARLGASIALIFVLTTGVRIGAALDPELGASIALLLGIALAIPALLVVRRIARRMEERADAQARSHAGSAALADALTKLHEDARMPLVTGAKRVHPDLYDRLVACGRDPGPRPSPPRRRRGILAGLGVAVFLVAPFAALHVLTSIDLASAPLAGHSAARWRLRVDPWDATAMLADAWATRRDEDLELAEAQKDAALHLGAPLPEIMELEAELLAARGDCPAARARFEDALAARAQRSLESALTSPLELGGWHLPPTLVTDCAYGAEDALPP